VAERSEAGQGVMGWSWLGEWQADRWQANESASSGAIEIIIY